jgi:hypothetical protein
MPSRPISRGAFDQRRQMLGRGAVAGGALEMRRKHPPAVQAAWSRRASRAPLGRKCVWLLGQKPWPLPDSIPGSDGDKR